MCGFEMEEPGLHLGEIPPKSDHDEIVSWHASVRAVCVSSEFGSKIYGLPVPLSPFGLGRFSLFPWAPPPQTTPMQL